MGVDWAQTKKWLAPFSTEELSSKINGKAARGNDFILTALLVGRTTYYLYE